MVRRLDPTLSAKFAGLRPMAEEQSPTSEKTRPTCELLTGSQTRANLSERVMW